MLAGGRGWGEGGREKRDIGPQDPNILQSALHTLLYQHISLQIHTNKTQLIKYQIFCENMHPYAVDTEKKKIQYTLYNIHIYIHIYSKIDTIQSKCSIMYTQCRKDTL